MLEKKLLNYLKEACSGRERRVSGAELARVLHVSGSDLRRLIHRLRRRGIPIGSDRSGYFYAVNAGEVYATIRQLRQMANGLEQAIRGLEQALDTFDRNDSGRDDA